jgi:hypothetical protein
MKSLIRATRKTKRSFVPITQFEFETFEVCVRRRNSGRPLRFGVGLTKLNGDHLSGPFKTILTPIDAARRTKILLPSPSLQGHGWMCLHLGARPVHHSAALSSRQVHLAAPNSFSTEAREPEQIAPSSHK